MESYAWCTLDSNAFIFGGFAQHDLTNFMEVFNLDTEKFRYEIINLPMIADDRFTADVLEEWKLKLKT